MSSWQDWGLTFWRILAILYLPLVALCAYWASRQAPSPPVAEAAQYMPRNHRIKLSDILPWDHARLVEQYLKTEVHQGEKITLAQVARDPVFIGRPNAIAAILSVPAATIYEQAVDAGTKIQICRGTQSFGPPAMVAAVQCEEQVCSLTISLPKIESQIDPDALAGATVAVPPRTCSEK